MTTATSTRTFSAVILLAALAAGCATAAPAHPTPEGARMGMADMKAMCDTHKKMMNEKTPAERNAMMEHHMKTATPDVLKRMEMMQEHCK